MSRASHELIRLLQGCGALRFGDFTLKSGDRSPFFINLGDVRTAAALDAVGTALATRLHAVVPDATLLFGPAYKGIALATATALAHRRTCGSDLALCFDRKEFKDHGEGGGYIGQFPTPGDRVVVIDDVISNGATKRQAMANLQARFGVTAAGILVVVDRVRRRDRSSLEGLSLEALVTIEDLVAYLADAHPEQADRVQRFYEEE